MPIRSTTPQSCSRVCIGFSEGHGAICIVRGLETPQGDATRGEHGRHRLLDERPNPLAERYRVLMDLPPVLLAFQTVMQLRYGAVRAHGSRIPSRSAARLRIGSRS